jgi:hypothetical protein
MNKASACSEFAQWDAFMCMHSQNSYQRVFSSATCWCAVTCCTSVRTVQLYRQEGSKHVAGAFEVLCSVLQCIACVQHVYVMYAMDVV